MLLLFLSLGAGVFLGGSGILPKRILSFSGKAMNLGVIFLLLTMGLRIGIDKETLGKLGTYGLQAFLFAIFAILGSIGFVWMLEKWLVRKEILFIDDSLVIQSNEAHPYRMTVVILGAFIIGIIIGISIFPKFWAKSISLLSTIALDYTLFAVGLDLGVNRSAWQQIWHLGWHVFLAPLGVAVGSILAGMLMGMLLGWSYWEGGAVGAGFGWYSLSGILITELHSVSLGTIAFLSNVFREVLSILIVPFLARKVSPLTLVAPGGATTMDTTLPLIVTVGPKGSGIIAFVNGLCLSALVPVLVPMLLGK